MGFTTGFISGATLPLLLSTLLIYTHHQSRQRQAALLSQQSLLLNSVFDPRIVPEEDAPRFAVRRASWAETWKDRWNADVEGAVRWAQGVRWSDVWRGLERVEKGVEGLREAGSGRGK